MTLERILLQTIKFDLRLEHPYTFLLKFAKILKGNICSACLCMTFLLVKILFFVFLIKINVMQMTPVMLTFSLLHNV